MSGNYSINSTDPTAARWTSAGAGITEPYNGSSVTLKIFIVFGAGLAMYNSCELIGMIFLTFTRYRGLYFWSLLVSSLGIIAYALGFLFHFMSITTGEVRWLAVFLLTVGWYAMVTGQALVLWSRLHLILDRGAKGERIVRWTMWMIIVDAVCLHVPTTVLTFGANSHDSRQPVFAYAYNIMEKIQMCGFFCQEVVLSTIYIVETVKILHMSLQPNTRTTMKQLILINVVIIILDLGLLGLEAASLYILETLIKGVIYSIKLKLEFAILGKLVNFVARSKSVTSEEHGLAASERKASVGFISATAPDKRADSHHRGEKSGSDLRDLSDLSEFVDMSKISRAAADTLQHPDSAIGQRKFPSHAGVGKDWEYDFARFQHVEDIERLDDDDHARGSDDGEEGAV